MTFDARMEQLRLRFQARAGEDRARLEESVAGERWDEILRIAHGLSGIAGVFGHHEVGEAAQLVEEAIDTGLGPEGVRPLCAALIERLERVGQPA
jgi:HPt (histidine-containing phosphotransfer) domain-containing protein